MRSIGTRRGWAMPIPMGRVVDLLASWSVHRHLAAVAYLFSAALAVTHLEDRLGYKVTTYFGLQYPQPIVYPLGFWALTALYALVALRLAGRRLREALGTAVAMGLVVHVSALALTVERDPALANLTASFFLRYVQVAVMALSAATFVVSFAVLALVRRGVVDPLWLPVAYLPAAHLVFGQPLRTVALVALAGVGFVVFERGRRWPGASALGRAGQALWVSSVAFGLGVFALALVFRLVAALRLAGMGLETVLLNSDDATQYHANALTFLRLQFISTDYSTGYSGIVAFLYWLTGARYWATGDWMPAVLAIQSVAAASVPVAVYLVGRRAFGEATGRLGAVLCALSQLLIFNSVNLTREMGAIALLAWALVILFTLEDGPRGRFFFLRILMLALVVGLLISIEPVFLLVSAALAVGLGSSRVEHSRLQQELSFVIVMVTALVLTLLIRPEPLLWLSFGVLVAVGFRYYPWTAPPRTLAVVAAFTVTAWTFTAFVNAALTGEFTVLTRTSDYAIHVSTDFNPHAKELWRRGVNVFAYPVTWFASFFGDPVTNTGLVTSKLWLDFRRFFFEGNTGAFDPVFMANGSFFAANLMFYSVVLVIAGLAAAGKELVEGVRRREKAIACAILVLYSAVYIVLFFSMTRYRATVQPLLLLFAAHGLTALGRLAGGWGALGGGSAAAEGEARWRPSRS